MSEIETQVSSLPGAQNHPEALGFTIPKATTRAAPVLSANGLSVAEYKRRQWFCEAQEGTTPEDVTQPGYWAHVASKMTPFDRIEVVAFDGSWMADLVVLANGRVAAKVKILSYHELDGGYSDMTSVNRSHEVKHRGPRKWSIIRLADNAIIKQDINTREEAETALNDYVRALGM